MSAAPITFAWRIVPIRMGGSGRIITFYLYAKRPTDAKEIVQGAGSKTSCRDIIKQLAAGTRAFREA